MEGVPHDYALSVRIDAADAARSAHKTVVTVTPPIVNAPLPTTFVCAIDVSGSMGYAVTSGVESTGYSRLDLVKHCLNTMLAMMDEQHSLCLITFSGAASMQLRTTRMDDAGRAKAAAVVAGLTTQWTGTNLWAGMEWGLDECERLADVPQNKVLLVFTDGESNVDPPRGVLATYEEYLQRPGGLPCSSMHLFGFGYDLNATLLSAIAERSRGLFAFIPDASMCGTVFINFVSNMFCVVVPRAELALPGLPQRPVVSLSTGQSADFVYDLTPGTEQGPVAYSVRNLDQPGDEAPLCSVTTTVQDLVSAASGEPADDADRQSRLLTSRQVVRAEFIAFLKRLIQAADKQPLPLAAAEIDRQLISLRQHDTSDGVIRAFVLELDSEHPDQGQVRKACSQLTWYHRWGRHHLLSLARAHALQLCHNFKDPSVQQYGGELFHGLQKRGLAIFKQLEPPPPSCAQQGGRAINMDALVDPNGGCIAGDVLVQLQDLSLVRVSDLKAGMALSNAATVRCVIEARAPAPTFTLVEVAAGVRLTPWHPVRLPGSAKWQFAKDAQCAGSRAVEAAATVYNVILDHGQSLIASAGPESVEIIALGHGIVDDPVATHPYLGTQRVVDDIARCAGFQDGRVVLDTTQYRWTRDPVTQLMNGLEELEE